MGGCGRLRDYRPDGEQKNMGATARMRAKPRLLDLFCGAGGAAMGYYQAGFEVVGIDIDEGGVKYAQKHFKKRNLKFKTDDAMKLSFEKDSFFRKKFKYGPFASILKIKVGAFKFSKFFAMSIGNFFNFLLKI